MFYLLIVLLISLEIIYFSRKHSTLTVKPDNCKFVKNKELIEISFILKFINTNNRKEIMIPELSINPLILGKSNFNSLTIEKAINTQHTDLNNRVDGYWQAYIIKSLSSSSVNVNIKIIDCNESNTIEKIENIWIDLNYINYSPFGRKRSKVNVPRLGRYILYSW